MGFILDEENSPYSNYSKLVNFDTESYSTQFTILDSSNYTILRETNNYDIAYSGNTLIEFIYDIPVYVYSTVSFERDFTIKIEYALNETNNWISLGESGDPNSLGEKGVDGCMYGASYSVRLSNHIFLKNIIGNKIRFKISIKGYNGERFIVNNGSNVRLSSNFYILQYEENNYLYNKLYSSLPRKLAELYSSDNSVKNMFNTTTFNIAAGSNSDIIFPQFSKSPLAGVFVIMDIPMESYQRVNTAADTYQIFTFSYSNNGGTSWIQYTSRNERIYRSVSDTAGNPKLGQGGYNRTERFYLYLDRDNDLIRMNNLMIKVNINCITTAQIVNPSGIDNTAKAQIKVYEIHSKNLSESKALIQSMPKDNLISNKKVFYKTDPITTVDLVDAVNYVPIYETGDLDCEIGSDILVDLCCSIKNGNSGNGSMNHPLGAAYAWPAAAPSMTPVPPTTIGAYHYNSGWFWNIVHWHYNNNLNQENWFVVPLDAGHVGANEGVLHVRAHVNSDQIVFDRNTIIWTKYSWYSYTGIDPWTWWGCDVTGSLAGGASNISYGLHVNQTVQESNVKHSDNGIKYKIEYSLDEGNSWLTYINENMPEGKITLYTNRTSGLGNIAAIGVNKGKQSAYAASTNKNQLLIKRSFLLENNSSNKIRIRISAKSIPKEIFRAVDADRGGAMWEPLIYKLPYSFAQWSMPNNIGAPGDDSNNHFTIHASLTEVKPNTP